MADRKRILVADDDPDLLDLLQMDLEHHGYDTLTAANGKDALQVAMSEKMFLASPRIVLCRMAVVAPRPIS